MKSMKVNRVFDSLKRKRKASTPPAHGISLLTSIPATATEGAGGPRVENPEVVAAQAVVSGRCQACYLEKELIQITSDLFASPRGRTDR